MSTPTAQTHRITADPTLRATSTVPDALLLLLAFASGSNDAIVYLSLGHVFTANMTGNTVLLGIALAQAQWLTASRSAVALAGYIAGVACGSIIIYRKDREGGQETWPPVITTALALEFLCLLALTVWGALLGQATVAGNVVYPLIVLSAVAMGIQSTAVRALGIASITTTFVTGTWTSLTAGVVTRISSLHRSFGRDENAPGSHTGLQGAVVGVYILAALAGAAARLQWHVTALVIPCATVALVIAVRVGVPSAFHNDDPTDHASPQESPQAPPPSSGTEDTSHDNRGGEQAKHGSSGTSEGSGEGNARAAPRAGDSPPAPTPPAAEPQAEAPGHAE